MDELFDWSAPIIDAGSKLLQGFLLYLPRLVGAIGLLLLGWLIARLLRRLTIRSALSIERIPNILGIGDRIGPHNVSRSTARILGNVVFWIVMLFFLTAVTNLLGLTLFSVWLDRLVAHLPNILSGVLIIWAGIVFGNLAREAVNAAAGSMPAAQRAILARGAQLLTLIMMVLIGVEQIGINTTIVTTVLALAVGASLTGVAIAFSIGARSLVSNLIGVRYLNKDYRVGEKINIGDYEGTILEITTTSVVLETERGRMTIPASLFAEEPSLLVEGNSNV